MFDGRLPSGFDPLEVSTADAQRLELLRRKFRTFGWAGKAVRIAVGTRLDRTIEET